MIQLSRNYTLPEKHEDDLAIKIIGVGGAGARGVRVYERRVGGRGGGGGGWGGGGGGAAAVIGVAVAGWWVRCSLAALRAPLWWPPVDPLSWAPCSPLELPFRAVPGLLPAAPLTWEGPLPG